MIWETETILDEELHQVLLLTNFDAAADSSRRRGVEATVNDIHTWNVADWQVVE